MSSVANYSVEGTGIPKGAISTNGKWTVSDLPTGTGFLKGGITDPAYTGISLSDLPTGTGFLKSSGGTNSWASITESDVTNLVSDLSAKIGLDSGGKVPNSLLPTAVARTNQTNTFGAFTQSFYGIIDAVTNPIKTTSVTYRNSGFGTTLQSGTLLDNVTVTLPTQTGTLLLTTGSGSSLTGIPTSITGTANNITASSSTGAVTLNLGSNVVVTGRDPQTFSKSVTFSNTATINGLRMSQITITSSSSPYFVLSTDGVIYADATTNNININLPVPSTVPGQIFVIKRTDDNIAKTVTVATLGGYIDWSGITTKSLDHRGQFVAFQSDGTNYHKIFEKSYSIFGYVPKGTGTTIPQNRYVTSPTSGAALTTFKVTASVMYLVPFVVEETTSYDEVIIKNTAGVAGSGALLGIYSDTGNTYPDKLVWSPGTTTISTPNTAAVRCYTYSGAPNQCATPTTVTNLPVTLTPGLYWLAVDDSGAVTFTAAAIGGLTPMLGTDTSITGQGVGYSVAYTCCTSSLPDPFSGTPTILTSATATPLVFLRAAS